MSFSREKYYPARKVDRMISIAFFGGFGLGMIAGVIFAIALSTVPGHAAESQSICGTPAQIIEGLDGLLGQVQIAQGVAGNGEELALWIDPDTRAWTLTITGEARRITCIAASGTHWQTNFEGDL
jgi:hypothetical protein